MKDTKVVYRFDLVGSHQWSVTLACMVEQTEVMHTTILMHTHLRNSSICCTCSVTPDGTVVICTSNNSVLEFMVTTRKEKKKDLKCFHGPPLVIQSAILEAFNILAWPVSEYM